MIEHFLHEELEWNYISRNSKVVLHETSNMFLNFSVSLPIKEDYIHMEQPIIVYLEPYMS